MVLQGAVIALGFVMLVVGFAVIAVDYRPYRIPSASMTPTIEVGETVLARKVDGGAVGRGDIVIFQDPVWGNAELIKRVVAVGGDTVACCDNGQRLTVNGVAIDEPYLNQGTGPGDPFSITVPAGRLFLMGDFRANSLDSRSHLEIASGTVAASAVKARVEATVLPIARTGVHKRTSAFDSIGAPTAHGPGPLRPAVYAMVVGVSLVVLASGIGSIVSLARWTRRRGKR
ncbi:signal peptidase I [Kitasatospora sp. NPDC048540]|uniref:signal peptidase I n=1 Tax=unclassified Kitasatospora TaxID=2633591 RepID=UPI00068F72A0|nr:signal peptidase I [Kitasatospora sp. MBT63]